ncbi:MAG TPA: hypothetical protein VGX68_08105 [Thermoanaerobaculia bacterium]|jgi:ketosteroid isomerase-like protein|nr:hypothetical protein [Thermoanaerobaculia bacterium]
MSAKRIQRESTEITAVLALALSLLAGPALGQTKAGILYPHVADTSHASGEARDFFTSFFTAKSRHDVAATMSHFSPQLVTYTDATLGWPLDGYDSLHALYSQFMPTWPAAGLSYPTRILGDTRSAVVAFTDTPELFGGELRILGAVDFKDGKVVRWVDYWDGASFDSKLYHEIRNPEAKFPTDFKEGAINASASAAIRTISTQLQGAFAAGDAKTASRLFSYDAVYEDMALRTQVLGREGIERYLEHALPQAPFGKGAKLRHVVGNDLGGGFEWFGSPSAGVRGGITALELNSKGEISRLTTVYDSRQLRDSDRRGLVLLAIR